MMKPKKLTVLYPDADSSVEITGISTNSRECHDGSLFVCTRGATADRHEFIADAVAHGAVAVVVSREVEDPGVPVVRVEDTNAELAALSRRFTDNPDEELSVIGVTGTDGKTSTATIIQALMGDDRCGYIGTNGRSCRGLHGDNPNTTPAVDRLYPYFREFLDHGCDTVATEASSEGFYFGRLDTVTFDISVYTNITSEHMNVHRTFDNYFACKMRLFEQTRTDGWCVLNHDDPHYHRVAEHCAGQVVSYGRHPDATLRIVRVELSIAGTAIDFDYRGHRFHVDSPLLGDFNVSNLAAAVLAVLCAGVPLDEALARIPAIAIPGRLDMIDTGSDYAVMVDYAHTPNGISQLLTFVAGLRPHRTIVVIGQAGERDATKRSTVGEVVLDHADYAIFTAEDPRGEDPAAICADIVATRCDTHSNYEIVLDRRQATRRAIDMAQSGDIVLILGKGAENYQKMSYGTIHYSDVEEAEAAIARRREREVSSQ